MLFLRIFSIYLLEIIFLISLTPSECNYLPTWESLDSRSLPEWYDEAKIGIFIHWGVWSVPGAGFNESTYLWYYLRNKQKEASDFMDKNYPPNFQYPEFASSFKAEFFSPEIWSNIFHASGAKYIVFVSKHHDGYSMWPSSNSFNWNAMDVGPKRDLLGELFSTVRSNTDLKIGVYYSLFEFFNSLYLSDKQSNFTKNDYIQTKVMPQLKDLVIKYKPDIIWSDGDWEAPSDYWSSKEFLSWLYSENSPVRDQIVVNDRWGSDSICKHGGFITCTDKFNPRTLLDGRKWENAMTLELDSWGYRYNFKLDNVISIEDLLEEMITTISCGGNININVGPTSQGTISPIFEERFRQMGEWLNINGEAIYRTKPWFSQNDTLNRDLVWYTSRFSTITYKKNLLEVYAISLKWPTLLETYDSSNYTITLNSSILCTGISALEFIGYDAKLNLKDYNNQKISQNVKSQLEYFCKDEMPFFAFINVKQLNPIYSLSKWAWVFKFYVII